MICRHHRTFWGSGTPSPAALSGRPERPATWPRFASPLRAPPPPPGRTLPPASPSASSNPRPFPRPERGRGSRPGTHRQADRQTNRRTAPDGRARRALRGPGGEYTPRECSALSFSGWLERSLGQISLGLRSRGGADPRQGNRPARRTAGLADLLNKAVPPKRPALLKGPLDPPATGLPTSLVLASAKDSSGRASVV